MHGCIYALLLLFIIIIISSIYSDVMLCARIRVCVYFLRRYHRLLRTQSKTDDIT